MSPFYDMRKSPCPVTVADGRYNKKGVGCSATVLNYATHKAGVQQSKSHFLSLRFHKTIPLNMWCSLPNKGNSKWYNFLVTLTQQNSPSHRDIHTVNPQISAETLISRVSNPAFWVHNYYFFVLQIYIALFSPSWIKIISTSKLASVWYICVMCVYENKLFKPGAHVEANLFGKWTLLNTNHFSGWNF